MAEAETAGAGKRARGRVLSWVVLVLIALGGFALQRALSPEPISVDPPDPRPLIAVAAYQRSTDPLVMRRLGRVHALHETRLAAEISGRVLFVHPGLRAGGRVDAGEVLLRLDDRPLRLRRAELEAEGRARRAEREQLSLRLSRLEDLARRDFVAGDQIDELRARLAGAEAAVERLDAQLDLVALDIERSVIAAPYAADILDATVAPGDLAQPGLVLARIVTAEAREVRIPLTLAELPTLEAAWRRQGLSAALEGVSDPGVALSQPRLAGTVDEASRTVLLAFTVADGRGLRRGEMVDVLLLIEPEVAHYRLPRSALQREAGYVWRLVDGDVLARAVVEPLLFSGDHVYVVSEDLGEHGEVMTTALPTITQGMAVQVRRPREAAP